MQTRADAAESKQKAAQVEAACRAATAPAEGGWFNLDPAEEKMRQRLYKNKKAAVESAFKAQDPSGEGLLTQEGFEAALGSLLIHLGKSATRHIWRIYKNEGMLAGGKLPLSAFMKRFILSAPKQSDEPQGPAQIETEGDLTSAVLRNKQKIVALCRQKDKARRGMVSGRAFFGVLAHLGIPLNELERNIVARKFSSTLGPGINYADFVRSFLSRSSYM